MSVLQWFDGFSRFGRFFFLRREGCGSKMGAQNGTPNWKQRLKHAVASWLNFDPCYPCSEQPARLRHGQRRHHADHQDVPCDRVSELVRGGSSSALDEKARPKPCVQNFHLLKNICYFPCWFKRECITTGNICYFPGVLTKRK